MNAGRWRVCLWPVRLPLAPRVFPRAALVYIGPPDDNRGMRRPDEGDHETDRVFELQEEIQQFKEAVVSHAVVDQVIGMTVALGRVTPEQGWTVLREVSQHTNVKLRRVAELVVLWDARGRFLPRSALSSKTPSTAMAPPRSRALRPSSQPRRQAGHRSPGT